MGEDFAFTSYIDESGDEGFTFKEDGSASSVWFVLSAVVVRRENDLAEMSVVDEVRSLLRKPERHVLHFRDLKHPERVAFVRRIAARRLRAVSVLIHKPSLPVEIYRKGALYRYATRLLLERVSWLCRDEGTRTRCCTELIFSNRANMKYEDLSKYLRKLASASDDRDVRIHWDAVGYDRIRALPHNKRMGLQVADAVASSAFFAVREYYGASEPRYITELRPIVYAHRGVRFAYGLKFMPAEKVNKKPPLRETEWLHSGGWMKAGPGP